nr:unnamed protein product [Naegleria fowleri]
MTIPHHHHDCKSPHLGSSSLLLDYLHNYDHQVKQQAILRFKQFFPKKSEPKYSIPKLMNNCERHDYSIKNTTIESYSDLSEEDQIEIAKARSLQDRPPAQDYEEEFQRALAISEQESLQTCLKPIMEFETLEVNTVENAIPQQSTSTTPNSENSPPAEEQEELAYLVKSFRRESWSLRMSQFLHERKKSNDEQILQKIFKRLDIMKEFDVNSKVKFFLLMIEAEVELDPELDVIMKDVRKM